MLSGLSICRRDNSLGHSQNLKAI